MTEEVITGCYQKDFDPLAIDQSLIALADWRITYFWLLLTFIFMTYLYMLCLGDFCPSSHNHLGQMCLW